MLIRIGNTLKAFAFSLLCIAILAKIENLIFISMISYGLGMILTNVGIAKIQDDIEKTKGE